MTTRISCGLASALFTGDLVPTTNRTSGLHPASSFLEDINAVLGVDFVMKDGVVYRQP